MLQASARRSLGFAWGLVAAWPAAQASRATRSHPRPPLACACRSSLPRPLAFAPAAWPTVGRRPVRPSRPSPRPTVRPSRAPLQAASGGPRRQHLPPAARAAHPQPASALGSGASRRPCAWPLAACLDRWTEVEAAGGGVGQRPVDGGWRRPVPAGAWGGAAGGPERWAPAASEPTRAPFVARCTFSLVLFRPRSLVRLTSPLEVAIRLNNN
ncbi:hypothetical protein PVAP13_2KG035532 [Panicum virgatum]|uniref:Uncharacterized protein n=1 Tax=Panicum virgatum TaxID=38727 RepID=A0A8T0VY91_PANVG|nr:hypothetical protein PVAP13_2KG035532 [Panicum virgatum]